MGSRTPPAFFFCVRSAKQLLADVVAAETPAESRRATPEVALAASVRALVPPLDLPAFA